MYSDVVKHCSLCPQCVIVNPFGKVNKPPLHPIPVSRPFQRSKHNEPICNKIRKLACCRFLTKFPLVLPVPDQKAICLAKLLVEQVITIFGVPESLLSDSGTNFTFLSDERLMFNVKYKKNQHHCLPPSVR